LLQVRNSRLELLNLHLGLTPLGVQLLDLTLQLGVRLPLTQLVLGELAVTLLFGVEFSFAAFEQTNLFSERLYFCRQLVTEAFFGSLLSKKLRLLMSKL
jgi:hypothetical protein